jgi:hypothetical protein
MGPHLPQKHKVLNNLISRVTAFSFTVNHPVSETHLYVKRDALRVDEG